MEIYRRKKMRLWMPRAVKVLQPFFICAFLLLFCARYADAKDKSAQAARPKVAPVVSRAVMEKIKSTLTANPWSLYLIYQNNIKGKMVTSVKTDILTFTQDVVFSQTLASEGYSKSGSDYRVRVDANGAYIWESILLHENQIDTVLLKGELQYGLMKGVIVYQPQGKPARTVNFTTVQPK